VQKNYFVLFQLTTAATKTARTTTKEGERMSYRLILLTSERFVEFSTRIFKASHTRVAKNTFVGDPMFLTKGFALVNKFVSKFSGVVNIFFSVLENLQLRLLFSYMHFFLLPGKKIQTNNGNFKKIGQHCFALCIPY